MRVRFAAIAGAAFLAGCTGGGDATSAESMDNDSEVTADGVATASMADPELAAWIAGNYAGMGQILYASGEADLDGDGAPEVLVYVGGPSMCGSGGCNLVVLQRTGQGFDRLGDLSVAQLPVGVFETSTNGWRDLAVSVYGGGIAGGVAKVPFGENQYASNPTVSPAEMSEAPFETIIAEEELEPLPE